jgi:hypothetical protein
MTMILLVVITNPHNKSGELFGTSRTTMFDENKPKKTKMHSRTQNRPSIRHLLVITVLHEASR